jgi:hypothetical protein
MNNSKILLIWVCGLRKIIMIKKEDDYIDYDTRDFSDLDIILLDILAIVICGKRSCKEFW